MPGGRDRLTCKAMADIVDLARRAVCYKGVGKPTSLLFSAKHSQ